MRKRHLAAAALLLCALPTPSLALAATRTVKKALHLRAGGALRIETYKGSVELVPWSRERIEVVARIESDPEDSGSHAERSVAGTRIAIEGGGSAVSISTDHDDEPRTFWGQRLLPAVHYRIRAPSRLRLALGDHKSRISLAGFEGELRLRSHKGRIDARKVEGRITLDLYKGRAFLDAVAGRVAVSTYKGAVTLRMRRMDGPSSLRTHKGRIELRLPPSQRPRLDVRLGRRATFENGLGGGGAGAGPGLTVRSHRGTVVLGRP